MLSLFFRPLYLGISSQEVALCAHIGTQASVKVIAHAQVALADQTANPSVTSVMAALNEVFAAAKVTRRRLVIVVAEDWARSFTVTPPGNVASIKDCRAALEMRFFQLFGEATTQWQVQADWQAKRPFLAYALPSDFVQGLLAAAKQAHCSVVSVQTQMLAAWAQARTQLKPESWLALSAGKDLHLGVIRSQGLETIRSLAAESLQSAEELQRQIQLETMRLGVSSPKHLQVLGVPPKSWLTTPSKDAQWTCSQLQTDAQCAELAKLGAAAQLASLGV